MVPVDVPIKGGGMAAVVEMTNLDDKDPLVAAIKTKNVGLKVSHHGGEHL